MRIENNLRLKEIQQAFEGKTIRVIAPASGTSPEKIDALRLMAQQAEKLSLEIPLDLLSNDVPYHSGSDEHRLEQLKSVLFDSRSNIVIWTLRGGYGSARLLSQLNKLPKPKVPKVFIGFSDNTALHLFLSQQWGWSTIHASGFAQLLDPNQETENFQRIAQVISQEVPEQSIQHLKPLNKAATENRAVKGCLTGGNLTILENSIGTFWQVKTAGKILFLEEVGEKGYRVDRTLYHLYEANLFQDVQAIVLGQFLEPSQDGTMAFALARFAGEMDQVSSNQRKGIPVYQTDQFGHGNKNYPLIYNAESEINAGTLSMKVRS